MQIDSENRTVLPITCVILTKNEEKAIWECLSSVDFCQQIIVVDSNSTDLTSKIVCDFGSELINFTWNGTYPKKKQWALQHPRVRNDWILLLDADERISIQLKNEIAGFMNDPDKYCKVWREFQTDELPSYWVVWPHSESKGWCDRITGRLTHNHVS